jgi:hypothetical protein
MKIGQSIWHCKRLYETEEGIIVYDEPKEYKLNFNYLTINSASGYLATLQYGEKLSKVWNMKALKLAFENVFSEGDVLYVEGNAPNIDKNYVNGDGANALITAILNHYISLSITLERIEP